VKIARTNRLLVGAAALATVLTLSACGSDDNSGSSTSTSAGTSAATSAASGDGSSAASATGDSPVTFECADGELRTSGSTAQGKAMEEWILAFNDKCGASLTPYGGGGSGQGITDFTNNNSEIAGSDSALNADQAAAAKSSRCGGADAINLPMVTGPIAIAYNVPGVDSLVVNADVLAKIFDGKITNWNDPALKALNPDATLPDLALESVHRQEDSGTTENFTKFLKAAAPDSWPYDPAKKWVGQGGTSAQASDGVAKEVAGREGAIGYLEWGFATDNDLAIAKVDTGNGTPVELTAESAGKAVDAATVVGTGMDVALKLDYATTEEGAYPIILVTYHIVCSANNGEKLPLIKAFLGYVATEGQDALAGVGAAPLPTAIQQKVVASIQALS